MQGFGWLLFVVGSAISILGGVVGFDVGFDIRVANLASLILGMSLMVSGAIFIGASFVASSFRSELINVMGLPESKLPKAEEREVAITAGGRTVRKEKQWFFRDQPFRSFEEAKKAEEEYRKRFGRDAAV